MDLLTAEEPYCRRLTNSHPRSSRTTAHRIR
jgi:hypothetical protein